jgi:uncharacterized protein
VQRLREPQENKRENAESALASRLRWRFSMSMNWYAAALTGLTVGTLSSAHCALMCGPVVMIGRVHAREHAVSGYFVGRFASYVSLGALVGGVGNALLRTTGAAWVERALSLVFALSLLWTAWQQWAPRSAPAPVQLRRGPRRPGIARLLVHVAQEPLLLGAATALLPCSVLFAAVAAAASTGSALTGAVLMGCFALVSGAAVVGLGGVLASSLQRPWRRVAVVMALVVGAAVLLVRPFSGPSADGPSCPLHAGSAR